jgi:hypothetical protein
MLQCVVALGFDLSSNKMWFVAFGQLNLQFKHKIGAYIEIKNLYIKLNIIANFAFFDFDKKLKINCSSCLA